jgi:hypothetical protein
LAQAKAYREIQASRYPGFAEEQGLQGLDDTLVEAHIRQHIISGVIGGMIQNAGRELLNNTESWHGTNAADAWFCGMTTPLALNLARTSWAFANS